MTVRQSAIAHIAKFILTHRGVKKGQYTMLHWILLSSYVATTTIFLGTVG